MERRTVELTARTGLCTSCGICKSMCPQACISWDRARGMFLPVIDPQRCVRCGICARVCPGLGFAYPPGTPMEAMTGQVHAAYNAWSRDAHIRHVSASGGVVSTLLETLLKSGAYDGAFCVDRYAYDEQLKTELVDWARLTGGIGSTDLPKSRYLPVSHEQTVAYMQENRAKRLILVGTSCAIRGLLCAIEQLKLDREQYLLVGLFCDKVFNYNVYAHMENAYGEGKKLSALHFKNKESGGWPGNMKLLFQDGTSAYQDKAARMDAKAYFAAERCLYCIDKLDVCADISLGDNYTEKNSSPLGSNSVIVRTQKGLSAWEAVCAGLEAYPVEMEQIAKAQYLEGRAQQLCFAELKQDEIRKETGETIDLNRGVVRRADSREYRRAWNMQRSMLNAGAVYDADPAELEKQRKRAAKRANGRGAVAYAKRVYRAIKRIVKRG